MSISICFYKEEMKTQVVELICNQYSYNLNSYTSFFSSFYEGEFQKDAIKIVALDNKKVVGFQSFFYWPYSYNGKILNSYQSGNSIVDVNYRGKGIFQKMLAYIYENPTKIPIDFLIGFPVEASYNSFIKSNWKNPFNLTWQIKINNLFSLFFGINKKTLSKTFDSAQIPFLATSSSQFRLTDSADFVRWRASFYKTEHYYFTYNLDGNSCQIGFKINVRKKIIKELIIGQINSNNYNQTFLESALQHFVKQVKKINFITLISIATNPFNEELTNSLKKMGFKPTKKKIYFIIKDFSQLPEINVNSNWVLYRGDLDTW